MRFDDAARGTFAQAIHKARSKRTADDTPIHSVRTLLEDLRTIALNTSAGAWEELPLEPIYSNHFGTSRQDLQTDGTKGIVITTAGGRIGQFPQAIPRYFLLASAEGQPAHR